MRAWWVGGLLLVSACSCEEKRVVEPGAPLAAPATTPAPAPLLVSATWVQQRLTPQQADLQARIEYGPTTTRLEVQLELPPGVQVTRGRTYFVLEPSPEPKVHVEGVSVRSDALPVNDLVLVVKGGTQAVKEPYRFGRR
ncbi:MAG: hypothetical protein SFW67_15910 [Myxococcaceae bacterium]|nr:hypothetical protein [Myxococcaceae bacterium]